MLRRFLWRLGVRQRGAEADAALVAAAEQAMHASGVSPDTFFFTHRGGRGEPDGEFGALLAGYEPLGGSEDPLWQEETAPTLVIGEVERIWAEIDAHDDWNAFEEKLTAIRRLGSALGEPPLPAGHVPPPAGQFSGP
jgi:hypothetical protein